MSVALCPGSFDPVTLGHLDIICRAARQFDRVYVCAMVNDRKGAGLLTLPQRTELLALALRDVENVVVESWEGWLVEYARRVGATAVVKGLRGEDDLAWELEMAAFNREYDRALALETVLLPAKEEYRLISSTLVREKLRRGESIAELVPAPVAGILEQRKGWRRDGGTS